MLFRQIHLLLLYFQLITKTNAHSLCRFQNMVIQLHGLWNAGDVGQLVGGNLIVLQCDGYAVIFFGNKLGGVCAKKGGQNTVIGAG